MMGHSMVARVADRLTVSLLLTWFVTLFAPLLVPFLVTGPVAAEQAMDAGAPTTEVAPLLPGWVLVIVLLAAAAGAFLLELVLVSGGILGLAAAILAAWAVIEAFQVHVLFGLVLLAILPFATWWLVRFGIQRIQASNMVPQSVIGGHAGVVHAAEKVGIRVGSTGVMVTKAMPTGAARFAEHEFDVVSRSGPLAIGDTVRVVALSGVSLQVERSESQSAQAAPEPSSADPSDPFEPSEPPQSAASS